MRHLNSCIVCTGILFQVIFSRGFASPPGSHKHYLKIRNPQELRDAFHYTGDSVCFLSSHRGGPEKNFSENSIATFKNTLRNTCSLMEIDPRYTKDSIMVVHHDPTLQRTTNGKGLVSDYTLKELKKLNLKDVEGNLTRNRIHTLKEVIEWARGKTILILDKKDVPIEDRIKIVEEYNSEPFTIIMAYTFEEAKLCYKMNNDIMMQVFIPTPEKCREFDQTGVPWSNVVAFVAHQMPADTRVFDMIHQRGALCILGSSRNLDLELSGGKVSSIYELEKSYNSIYRKGVDIIETDIPVEVSKVVGKRLSSPTFRAKFVK